MLRRDRRRRRIHGHRLQSRRLHVRHGRSLADTTIRVDAAAAASTESDPGAPGFDLDADAEPPPYADAHMVGDAFDTND